MAARTAVLRFSVMKATFNSSPAIANQHIRAYRGRKFYNRSSVQHNDAAKQTYRSQAQNPIAASMAESMTPTRSDTSAQEQDAKNAAFLGEADSDDGFEADVEINPEAHRHKFDDVNASGLHGQAGEGDEPVERERKPQEAVDASQSAYLGEADDDFADQADREINPEKYRHRIDDPSLSGTHGESGEGDAHIERK